MEKRHILGLDLGTNSIGWAMLTATSDDLLPHCEKINSAGVRVIPTDAATLGDFERGNSQSSTAERTAQRLIRRSYERKKLRRERLHRILTILHFLPEHYAQKIDRYGKFTTHPEPKLPWTTDSQGHPTFLFQESFHEMLDDFRLHQPQSTSQERKIPYDWTLYYLRKKALTQKIHKEELAWILLNFNQKRGYYQLREEAKSSQSQKIRQYLVSSTVCDITDTKQLYKGLKILIVTLEDGTKGKIFQKEIPDWIGQKKDILVTVDIDKDGKDKYDETGALSCRFKIPTEQEWSEQWELVKTKTQTDLDRSGKTVGCYIYDTLLQTPKQKIRGKLVRTIERTYYKEELRQILEKQKEFHPELRDRQLYETCVNELYPQNENHRNSTAQDLSRLLLDDVLFYQRPLKSKKSLIANCPYEEYTQVDKATGEIRHFSPKCIAKSHPLFQEFRLWQFLSNLRIYQREAILNGKRCFDVDVTSRFLKDENDYTDLFDWLNRQKTIKQDTLLKYPPFRLNKSERSAYRWNYVESKDYPGNETHALLLEYLKKAGIPADFLNRETEEALWHILYSVSDSIELQKALNTFAAKHQLGDTFATTFASIPPFKKDYGAYSYRAIKKLLPLMRMGKYWDESAIDPSTRERIGKIITGEYDETIRKRVREKAIHLSELSSFRGLPLWLACYVVYDRHSEAKTIQRWTQPADIDTYLSNFKQHSLHNPLVEQVVMETLRTVRDIWKQEGHIDEIHLELGREMKSSSKERAQMTQRNLQEENTNLRIRALLSELANPELEIENVRPYSPYQQELLKIYEDGVLNSEENIPDDIKNIINKFKGYNTPNRPTKAEVQRYKLWLEQKYRSPYTGAIIPLGKLFTSAYEIEHIIPQARYFDNSFSNKIICESAVNKLKDTQLGHEFIKSHQGEIVQLGFGQSVRIQTIEAYEQFVKEHYSHNPAKLKKLLMDDLPDNFTSRQLNDTRYISKFIMALLSNIVREEDEQEGISKNLIVCTGNITDRLKKDWGINDVWNQIILPRFLRLNEMSGSTRFTTYNTNHQLIPSVPLEFLKGFNKKRIDHRHHAMDAIVIACASRNIVNYLNNESFHKDSKISRYDLQRLLCDKKRIDAQGNYHWFIKKPWPTFTTDVYATLQNIIVSFKKNLRITTRSTNYYQHYVDGKKKFVKQEGENLAIRKPLHKETFYGEVNLRDIKTVPLKEALKRPKTIVEKDLKKKLKELLAQNYNEKQIRQYFEDHKDTWQDIDLKKIEVYYFTNETKYRFFASRVPLSTDFGPEMIDKITDTGIRKILLRHLEMHGNDPKSAFTPEGIEEMNRNITALNDGKYHQPIYKVRKYEQANKFAVGNTGNKVHQYVEAAKGTNLFFSVYETEEEDKKTGETIQKRSFKTLSLREAIRRRTDKSSGEQTDLPKFTLSPNDLVYVPTPEELKNKRVNHPLNRERIYKMVSCTGIKCHFIPFYVATCIVDKYEYTTENKMVKAITGETIKEICIPLQIDRLGNLIE